MGLQFDVILNSRFLKVNKNTAIYRYSYDISIKTPNINTFISPITTYVTEKEMGFKLFERKGEERWEGSSTCIRSKPSMILDNNI